MLGSSPVVVTWLARVLARPRLATQTVSASHAPTLDTVSLCYACRTYVICIHMRMCAAEHNTGSVSKVTPLPSRVHVLDLLLPSSIAAMRQAYQGSQMTAGVSWSHLFDEGILALDALLHAVHALQLAQDVGDRIDLYGAAAKVRQALLVPLHIVAAVVLHILQQVSQPYSLLTILYSSP